MKLTITIEKLPTKKGSGYIAYIEELGSEYISNAISRKLALIQLLEKSMNKLSNANGLMIFDKKRNKYYDKNKFDSQ